jgi:hypothetical protein
MYFEQLTATDFAFHLFIRPLKTILAAMQMI